MTRTSPKGSNGDGRRIQLGFGGLHANVRDHIGHFFKTTDEWKSVVIPYFKAGLEGGDKCVYVMSPEAHDENEITRSLAAVGVDADSCRASGQLILGTGKSRPEEMEAWLNEAVSQVPQRFGLVRWGGDMTWSLKNMPTTEALMTWECTCNVKDVPAVYLCQYDLTQFLGNVIVDALKTHPLCIVGGAIHKNPYYVQPEVFLEQLRRESLA